MQACNLVQGVDTALLQICIDGVYIYIYTYLMYNIDIYLHASQTHATVLIDFDELVIGACRGRPFRLVAQKRFWTVSASLVPRAVLSIVYLFWDEDATFVVC